jgi:hypothetical protein
LEGGVNYRQRWSWGCPCPRKLRGLGQDVFVEANELWRGVDTKLFGQDMAGSLEGSESLGLAAATVERQHQLPPSPLAQRFGGHGRLEVRHKGHMLAHGDTHINDVFFRASTQLLKADDLSRRPGVLT